MPQLVSATWFALLLMQERWQSDYESGHLSLLYRYIFVWEWTRNVCHWATGDRLLLNQYKQIADLMVNLSEFPETVGAFCLPAFFINLDRADVYNAGKVTLCCGSESVLGHYSLSAAHHHWSQKGLNTYMDKKNIHRRRYNMWPLHCATV